MTGNTGPDGGVTKLMPASVMTELISYLSMPTGLDGSSAKITPVGESLQTFTSPSKMIGRGLTMIQN